MRNKSLCCISILILASPVLAAPKSHTVTFGRPLDVKVTIGLSDSKASDTKLRPLYVDGRLKEYTTGTVHDVTDRLFVVQRAFRVNDSLGSAPSWIWQLGGWLLVDRSTGRVSLVNLPDFDPYYSNASWYRDYVAYWAASEDGTKTYPAVSQLGRRKPVFTGTAHPLGATGDGPAQCSLPGWRRNPARITFQSTEGNVTYEIKGHSGNLVKQAEEDDSGSD